MNVITCFVFGTFCLRVVCNCTYMHKQVRVPARPSGEHSTAVSPVAEQVLAIVGPVVAALASLVVQGRK